jgi:hypothetical protein
MESVITEVITPALDDDECGAVGGMHGRGNKSTQRRPVPMPLCPPQIPHDLTRARNQAVTVGSGRLTQSYDTASLKYEGGPKNNRNRPVAHVCFLVTSCAAR